MDDRIRLEDAMLELYKAWGFLVTTGKQAYVILGTDVSSLRKELDKRGFENVEITQKPRSYFGLY